jgi:RNA polymerase sigma factor (sigma-70 family)
MAAMETQSRSRLRVFFESEYHKLAGFVRSQIADAGDRDSADIIQDVALNLFEKADITAPVENLAGYVYQAIRNRAVDYLRRRRRHDEFDENHPNALPLTGKETDIELRWQLLQVLDELDERSRAIVVATEIEGLTFEELSEQWDEPIGTLLSRKSRAMKKLRTSLVGQGFGK